MIKLENWSVRGDSSPYVAPEQRTLILRGEVYGHPRFEDGEVIWTSPIVSVDCRIIATKNSVYELGGVEQVFLRWCSENGHHIPIGDNPIKWHTNIK